MGGAGPGEELLGATLFGTAGRRPNRGCGPRAAAEAARHNVTKPHRPLTYQDAGREWPVGFGSGEPEHAIWILVDLRYLRSNLRYPTI